MKILSIDFDFFQNTTKELVKFYYPDGADLGTRMSQIIWATRYMDCSESADKIKGVTIDEKLYDSLVDILLNQNQHIPVMIAESHKNIYNFICNIASEHTDSLKIVNIDFHHDISNENPELDCGNWISHLEKIYPKLGVSWITRELSTEIYGLDDNDIKEAKIEFNLNNIKDMQFDAIFLCRSDCWTPPHLDVHFSTLILHCLCHYASVDLNNDVACRRGFEFSDLSAEEVSVAQTLRDVFNETVSKDLKLC